MDMKYIQNIAYVGLTHTNDSRVRNFSIGIINMCCRAGALYFKRRIVP